MKMFRTRYRIVRDHFLGYEVQFRCWFMPFWLQAGFSNTHPSIERAEEYAWRHMNKVVKEIKR